ncbi:hypothetical protein BDN72DRAFT_955834 [Pluteus cervinus]|uniref:Uncharacterized protein n=1 Tax=Pluteus cervinus TaxID=181527 RepID=A0ACD3B8U8_9AGAR|nr:hypothetical protein BDN72DRAFT_955834 [Pluteus cervinus]
MAIFISQNVSWLSNEEGFLNPQRAPILVSAVSESFASLSAKPPFANVWNGGLSKWLSDTNHSFNFK